MDTLIPAKRAEVMARVRSKNTKPELMLRSSLHAVGFRYRLHVSKLPGSPDLVLPRYRSVCFVHGCFWHRHIGCKRTTTPATRRDYWDAKFIANVNRDARNRKLLLDTGWRVAVVWECSLQPRNLDLTITELEAWLVGNENEFESKLLKVQSNG